MLHLNSLFLNKTCKFWKTFLICWPPYWMWMAISFMHFSVWKMLTNTQRSVSVNMDLLIRDTGSQAAGFIIVLLIHLLWCYVADHLNHLLSPFQSVFPRSLSLPVIKKIGKIYTCGITFEIVPTGIWFQQLERKGEKTSVIHCRRCQKNVATHSHFRNMKPVKVFHESSSIFLQCLISLLQEKCCRETVATGSLR